LNPKNKIPKISSSKTIQIESEMMGGGHIGKKSYKIQALSSSSMFNSNVRMLQC